jgi:RNA polymerase sigma factor (sigma-70 family)
MPRGKQHSVIRYLRRAASLSPDADRTDGELLDLYLASRDEASFEALLHRHAPMVLGVCRRILQNDDDAHDAFQATFLMFLRKAATIRPRAMVGNWLHGVAYKTALKAQAMNRHRRAKEREARANVRPPASQEALQDRLDLLDEALTRLPAKYRSAIVLCDLEGKTIKEAAHQLNCPPGTVASRLANGRALLARRLTRYGLGLAAVTVAQGQAQSAVALGTLKSLFASLLKAAATVAAGQDVASVMSAKVVLLTERVVKAMLIAKLKTLTIATLVTAVLAGGGVLWGYSTLKAGQKKLAVAASSFVAATDEKPKSDKELIQGTWIPVSGEQNGKKIPKEKLMGKLILTEDKFTLELAGGEVREGTYTIDPKKKPKELDLVFGKNTVMGIYELNRS